MKKLFSLLLMIIFSLIAADLYSEVVVFQGAPRYKSISTPKDFISERTEDTGSIDPKLTITKEGKEYIWYSRNKYKLRYFESTESVKYFVRIDHTDYIKISVIPDGKRSPGMENYKYIYMESVSGESGFTASYWGYGGKLEL